MIVIYKILNKINNKIYIGSAKNFHKRKLQHSRSLRSGSHYNVHLQRAFNKYGEDNFEFGVLEELTETENLIAREQFWINELNPYYNINKVANSSLGVKRRKETIEKVRQANLGLKHPEWRNEIKRKAQGGDNHWTRKKETPFSEASRKKMSESHKNLYKNGYENPSKRKIKQFDAGMNFIEEYGSVTEAANVTGIERRAISHCLNGKSKSSGGFLWQ